MSEFPQAGAARAPALTTALAIALGILIDRWLAPQWSLWVVAAPLCFALALVFYLFRRMPTAVVAALLLVACLGGLRHHSVRNLRRSDDVSRFAREQPQPVELLGVVRTPVEIKAAQHDAMTPAWMRNDRSVCEIDCESIVSGGREEPASGRIRLDVTGHLLHAHVGDRVRIVGELMRPAPRRNPGGFDFAAYLRDRGIDCLVRTSHPDAVQRIESDPGWLDRLARRRHRLREECRAVLVQYVRPDNVPVAASLLLGDRTGMTDDVRSAFAQSGTMHLLAISGLHVGILAGILYLICRSLHLSPLATAILLISGVLAYAFITDHRPPVVRASVMAVVFVSALPWMRKTSVLNALAVSAVVILLASPTDLFDTGAQLSFLAVLGIAGAARLLAREATVRDPLAPEPSRWSRLWRPVGERLKQGYVITAAIWLFTLPLTMIRFHLASPVGFLINVLLIPYAAVLLFFGFLLLFCGLLTPWCAGVPGAAFDHLIAGLMWVVESTSGSALGHVYLAGPPTWWLAGWYAALAVAGGVIRLPLASRYAWRILFIWTGVGLVWGLLPADRDGLRCTFLSVGHGCAVVVELPGGTTLVSDAGAFGSPGRAQSAVQNALWFSGSNRIDALIVSHADVDHFNAVSGLARTLPIGVILLSAPSLDFSQPSVEALCEDAASAGVPLKIVHAGDRLLADPQATIEILHPPPGAGEAEDNANSIVLRITYAQRTILLTGDLEGAGLDALLASNPKPVDVMLAPHHGSAAANPPELAAWADPQIVVVSTGYHGVADRLAPVYGPSATVLSTAESGAVTVTISPKGDLTVEQFAGTHIR